MSQQLRCHPGFPVCMAFGAGVTADNVPGIKSGWLSAVNSATLESLPTGAAAGQEAFPAVNTPEWETMNERRAELIRKDLDQGLTPAERDEYDRLQRLSLAAVVTAFPQPTPNFKELAQLREEFRSTPAPVTE